MKETAVTLRIHRDIFPHTDYGYTWTECIWFERDGKHISPSIPAAGCCERTGHLPGGPLASDIPSETAHYAPSGVARTVKSESTHAGNYRVGSVCIVAC